MAGGPRCRWPLLLALAVLTVGGVRAAAADGVTWSADHQPLAEALAALGTLTPATPELGYELATGGAARSTVTVCLRAAEPATVRQALAHAAGVWWAEATTADGATVVLTTSRRLPAGPLTARTHPSDLLRDPAAEELVPRLMEPWRNGSDILHDQQAGTWVATLDATGQARLIELLSLLQRPLPSAPPVLAAMPASDPQLAIAGTLHAGPWSAWCDELARIAGLSVSLETGIDQGTGGAGAPALLLGGTRADLPRLLATAGLRAAVLRGVLCLGRAAPPGERLHPALRRRLAVVPLPHLAADDAAGRRITDALRRQVSPAAWGEPGWALEWIASGPAKPGFLLVAADPPTIHGVLDALDVLDRLGVAEGLAALAH